MRTSTVCMRLYIGKNLLILCNNNCFHTFVLLECFINFNSFTRILVLQNISSHSTLNRLKCDKQILPFVGFEQGL